jgi:hypothetical protein
VGGWVVPWDEEGSQEDIEFPIFSAHGFVRVSRDEAADEAEEDVQDNHYSCQGTTITRG